MESNLNDAGSYASSSFFWCAGFWGGWGGGVENAAYKEKLKRKVK